MCVYGWEIFSPWQDNLHGTFFFFFFFLEIHRMKLCAHCALCFLSWHCDLVFEFICMSQHKLISSGQTFVLLQKHGLGPHGERTALTEQWTGEWTKICLNLLKASLWRTHAVIIILFIFYNQKCEGKCIMWNTFIPTHRNIFLMHDVIRAMTKMSHFKEFDCSINLLL